SDEIGHQAVHQVRIETRRLFHLYSFYHYSDSQSRCRFLWIEAAMVRRIDSMITHLKFVGIPVTDQDAALAFYTDKLGFKVVTDQPMGPTQRWIELRVGNSDSRVVLFTPDGHRDRIGTFFNGSFACDNVEATYAELSA